MMMRMFKRIIIAGIVLGVLVLVTFSFAFITEKRPTCFDGVKNQIEEDIDCGGSCQMICEKRPLGEVNVESAHVFSVGEKTYAAVAKIRNTDAEFGVSRISYEFKFYDDTGGFVGSQLGFSFILPATERYVVEPRIDFSGDKIARTEFVVHEIVWERLKEYRGVPELIVRDRIYKQTPSGPHFSEFSGILRNASGFDFDTIIVSILLRESQGEIRAVGTIEVKTMKSGEERFFKVSWPLPFAGEVVSVDVFPETNVFLETNFIERHGTQERFQEFIQ